MMHEPHSPPSIVFFHETEKCLRGHRSRIIAAFISPVPHSISRKALSPTYLVG